MPEGFVVVGCHGNTSALSPFIILLASLRSEEVILKKIAEAIICWWLSWKQLYTHAYQVSPPCVLY